MIPEFLRNRKTYMLTALVFTIIGVLSLSYAFFSRQSLLGESSNNTINIQTIEGTSQSFITTYQNGSNEIKTGILNLTDTPYTKMSKFEVHNVYDYSLNVTINWDYVSSTLIQSDSSYNLYECSSTNFVSVTMDNVGSTCTLASPTTGNVLPNTGEASRLQNDSDITMLADQTRYYVVIITIGVSNNGRNFQGIIKTKDRFKHILTINYDNGSDSTNMDLASGDEINLPTVTKTGYTFDKWQLTTNYDSSLNESTFIMGSEDTTVKAIWNANTYTVTYNCNGGTNIVSSSIHEYDKTSNLVSNACYKISDGSMGMIYKFTGWNYQSQIYDNGQTINNLTSIDNDTLIFTASWSDLFSFSSSYTVINDSVFTSVPGDWRIKILSTGTLKFNEAVFADVFMVGGGGACDLTSSGKCYYADGGSTITSSVDIDTDGNYLTIGLGGQSRSSSGNPTTGFGLTADGGYSRDGYNAGYSDGVFAFNDSFSDAQFYGGTMGTTGNAPNNSGKGSYNGCGGTSYKGGSGIIIIRNHR